MLIEEIKSINSSKKELKKFGYSIGVVLLLVAGIFFYYGKEEAAVYIGIIGAVLVISGFILPVILLPLQKVWMTLAVVLGFVSSRVILMILFYFVITPIGLTTKIFRKNFLNTKMEKKNLSYWEIRPETEYTKEQTNRQF